MMDSGCWCVAKRPQWVSKARETWDAWDRHLGPSKELHADFYGKHGDPLDWPTYKRRYLAEMKEQTGRIAELAKRVLAGETVTLLCSNACRDESRCHRSLLKQLIDEAARRDVGR